MFLKNNSAIKITTQKIKTTILVNKTLFSDRKVMAGTWQRIHVSLKGPQSEQDKRHTDLKCSQTENEHGLDLRKIIGTKLCTAIQEGCSRGTFSPTEEKAALGNPGEAHVPVGWVRSLNRTRAPGAARRAGTGVPGTGATVRTGWWEGQRGSGVRSRETQQGQEGTC